MVLAHERSFRWEGPAEQICGLLGGVVAGVTNVPGKGQLKAPRKALVRAGGYGNCGSPDVAPVLWNGLGLTAARTKKG